MVRLLNKLKKRKEGMRVGSKGFHLRASQAGDAWGCFTFFLILQYMYTHTHTISSLLLSYRLFQGMDLTLVIGICLTLPGIWPIRTEGEEAPTE